LSNIVHCFFIDFYLVLQRYLLIIWYKMQLFDTKQVLVVKHI